MYFHMYSVNESDRLKDPSENEKRRERPGERLGQYCLGGHDPYGVERAYEETRITPFTSKDRVPRLEKESRNMWTYSNLSGKLYFNMKFLSVAL